MCVVILLVGYEPTSPRAGNKGKSPDASVVDEKKQRVPEADMTDLPQTSGKPSNHELCHQYVETSKTSRQAGYFVRGMFFVSKILQ